MDKNAASSQTFIVQVSSQQNATWQGTVTYANGQQTRPFRSMFELAKLVDSIVQHNQAQTD